jgi:ABC-2 type transport system ATP-binding protein
MALVSLKDVRVSYGDLEALRGVTFEISGGAVGLLGPNGAGKSTLLRALLGFIRPSGGTIRMFDRTMPEHALDARQRLGYMPERDMVSPKVSAVSFLTYCGRLSGMSRVDAMERAHEVLNYVGIGENRYRKMETYSTGMCQRVKFAQALVHDPKLLLLDEPTNGLDPEGRVEMLDLIRELAYQRRVTVLLSSHLLPDVEHVCDRVIMIAKGRVVVDGTMQGITAQRDGQFELRVRDNKEAFLAALRDRGLAYREEQTGNVLVTAPAGLDARTFFELAHSRNAQIRHFRPVRHSLEEVFMQAIGNE